MTPTQIEQAARERYNSVGDTFWSQSEILTLMHQACLELVQECGVLIEATYTTTSVASQQEYSYPSSVLEIKRITYDGSKLMPITMRDDDQLTLSDQSQTATGNPQYYYIFDRTLYLRPLPVSSGETIKIFSYNEPQTLTISSTLEIPTLFHMDIVNFIAGMMASKDESTAFFDRYITNENSLWEKAKKRAVKWAARRKRADGPAMVQAEETHPLTYPGSQ
jgi:hypothetical protein